MSSRIQKAEDAKSRADSIRKDLQSYSRQPFIDILSRIMSCEPTLDALQSFANDHPDRWANAVQTFSRLSGYHDKLEIKGNLNITIQNMGDAELLNELEEINRKLIDLEATDITPDALADEDEIVTLNETLKSPNAEIGE